MICQFYTFTNYNPVIMVIIHYFSDLSLDDLPRNLQYSLCEPTASCAACQRHIFTSGFPLVFEGQIHLYSLYYVALCCSLKCMRLANVLIQLPVVYPEPEDLDQVLVLVNWSFAEQTVWFLVELFVMKVGLIRCIFIVFIIVCAVTVISCMTHLPLL